LEARGFFGARAALGLSAFAGAGRYARRCSALAHARAAGHDDPAILGAADQQRVEPGEQRGAADEALVALPLDAVVDALPGHPCPRRW
jgi:hypothetical protein